MMNSFKARIIKANRLLQSKVGTGSIDAEKISRSQDIIDAHQITFQADFQIMALTYIQDLGAALSHARTIAATTDKKQHRIAINRLTVPVMHLKANGLMFGYPLISALAEIMLDFLETLDHLDTDIIDITQAHYTSLQVIIKTNMTGDGGATGHELATEIRQACKRYFTKMENKGTPIEKSDLFMAG